MRPRLSLTATSRALTLAMAVALSGAVSGAAWAANPVEQHNSNAVWFENWTGLRNATLTVSMPDGQIATIHAATGTPVFQLTGSEIPDGIYRYELNAATEEQVKIVNPQNNGRGDAASDSQAKPFYLVGHFTVSRGVIITPEAESETDN